jgi:hypothetical protein
MFSPTGRSALITLLTAALAAALPAGSAHAQCGGGGQQNRSPMQGRPQQQNALFAASRPLTGGGVQFTGLTAQQPQQNALFGAGPQQQQQNAMLAALLQQQQQNAMLAAMQQQQQQQNAFQPVAQQAQGQQNVVRAAQPPRQNAAAQVRAVVVPDVKDPDPVPEDPADVAARKVKLARTLLDEARAADREGDRDLAGKLRERAGDRLQQVVARFPGTRAADDAQALLDKIGF